MTDTTETQDLVITRVFDAPRELVYRAFTDPDQLAAWFGPAGWSVPRETVSVEARVGGHQRFTMVNDADPSMASAVDATFTELVENELLVGTQRVDFGAGEIAMALRLEFHDEGGRTRLVLRQGPHRPELTGGAREGWASSFDKLDALLAR
ncbi:SRPBCC family protein [Micromonospora coerulea]|uniref:SRPBCC family protein n=1 Tax=Micromonospora coerulea TaxID=47856 RepID=UPI001905E8C1|nr:SRPBCC domain-containing protein [Micromonospora veneta]